MVTRPCPTRAIFGSLFSRKLSFSRKGNIFFLAVFVANLTLYPQEATDWAEGDAWREVPGSIPGQAQLFFFFFFYVIAFDKGERLHSAVAFENFGAFIDKDLAPPPPPNPPTPEEFLWGEIIQGKWRNFHRPCAQPRSQALSSLPPERGCHVLCFYQESSFNLPRVLVCFLVQFDLLFAFGVLSCRILDSASLFILYVHDHNRLGFGMLTLETTVFDCICWFYSSSRDRKGQSYPVEYCLESVEEYSEGRVHKSEPGPRNGNVSLVSELHNYSTRSASSNQVAIPSFRTNLRRFCPSIIGSFFWNDIPQFIRDKPSKKMFRKALSRWYLAQY